MTQVYDTYSNAVAEWVSGIIKHHFNLESYNASLEIL